MKMIRNISLITSLLLASCSSIYGGSTSSTGDQSISSTPTVIEFEANVDTTSYKTVTFTNRSDENYEIYNLALVDNVCGSFSIYNILDASQNILFQAGDSVSVSVVSGETIDINVQFSPTACELTEYSTTLAIYYTTSSDVSSSETITFNALVEDTTPETTVCGESESRTYYDEYDNPTERSLPVLDGDKSYYLKVDTMSAYIQTTGAFLSFATKVGTNINTQYIAEEDLYVPAYIPVYTDEEANVSIPDIDDCAGFVIPSPITDQFFIGADITVTTEDTFTGTIDRDDEVGNLTIPGFEIVLYSYINNSNSLLQSTDGEFRVKINVDLTTGYTDSNSYLETLSEEVDDNGDPLLSISGDQMYGKKIRHGTVTLVGIGTFMDDNPIMSSEGVSGIIDNEAYLFIQLEGIITQEE